MSVNNPEIIENSLVELQKLNNSIKLITSQILEIQDDDEVLQTNDQELSAKIKELDKKAKNNFSDCRELIQKLEQRILESDHEFYDRFQISKENFSNTKISYNSHLLRAMSSLKSSSRNQLLTSTNDHPSKISNNNNNNLRSRNKLDQKTKNKSAAEINSNLTSLNQAMENTVSGSAALLEQLNEQTDKMKNSSNEVKGQKTLIEDGQKLLKKYKQREFTDKILIYFGLLTYFLTIIYILLKRIFGFFL